MQEQRDQPADGLNQTYSLVYGLLLRPAHEIDAVDDAPVVLTDGGKSRVTMHLIEGDREQIRRTLLQSIDAFFELHE